jgi:predicted phage terminase large subunit-like protein
MEKRLSKNKQQQEELEKIRLEEMRLQLAKASAKRTSPPFTFREHIERYWSVVEPAFPFIDNWHIGAIAEHLTAVTEGQIRKLAIEVPPGAMKSLSCNVLWPSWEWTFMPWLKYLYGSYSQDFAIRDSKRMRTLVESEEYQRDHGEVFSLLKDTNRQDLFANDQTGVRQAVGVGGGAGVRVDRAIGDDTLTPEGVESPATLRETHRWWFELIPGRAQNIQTMASILVNQRLHKKDLSGEVRARGLGYTFLTIPMRYEKKVQIEVKMDLVSDVDGVKSFEPTRFVPKIVDPRTTEGELYFKDRFPEAEVKTLEKNLGIYAVAAQLQQNPINRTGEMKMFSRTRFEKNIRKEYPTGLTLVRYWDKAFTSGGGAYTVGVLMGKTKEDDFWILDVKRGQWGNEIEEDAYLAAVTAGERPMGYRDRRILECAREDKRRHGLVKTWLEHEPGSQGEDSCKVLIKLLKGFPVDDDPVKKDKTVRAMSYSSQQLAGNVYLVEGEWNEEFISEHEQFPDGHYKDQVDASSGGFNKLVTVKKMSHRIV